MSDTIAPQTVRRQARDVITALGEAMIELRQGPGETFCTGPGGDTSNVLVAAARQGARTRYISRVGSDRFGQDLRALWDREQVDSRAVTIDPDAPTGIYFSYAARADGTRQYEYRRVGSAASRITRTEIDKVDWSVVAWLHLSSITQCISVSACEAAFHAVACARAAGVRISYDTNFRPSLCSAQRAIAYVRQMAGMSDLFLPSREDLAMLTGIEDIARQIAWCGAQGAHCVVLKDGARGAWVWQEGGSELELLRAPVVDAIDTSGAGDCFVGTLLAHLLAGQTLHHAVVNANRAAATSVTRPGAVDSYPHAMVAASGDPE
jgi:2-dehydro-3-deoxygluconokinase